MLKNTAVMTGKIHRFTRKFYARELGCCGLGAGQVLFLTKLHENRDVSQDELSELLCFDKGTTAKALKKLEEDGYILRRRDETDKRGYVISLTEKGKDAACFAEGKIGEWNDVVLKGFSAGERKFFMEMLEKAFLNVSEYMREEKS